LAIGFCLSLPASAATIVWVSFHPGDNTPGSGAAGTGLTAASDKGYTDLLEANGYNVTRYVTTATPDTALLNAADLVIISRSVNSANYQDAAATTWNATITAPMMILSGYAIRQNRLGLSAGNTIPDTTGDIRLTATDPTHQIFAGIELTGGVMVNPYAGVVKHPVTGAQMRGISIITEAANANGKVLATVAAGSAHSAIGAMVIAEWPAGVTVTHANGAGTDVLAGPRLVFLTGARETDGVSSETAGNYDLHPDGAKMFINAARYMLGESGETATSPNPQNQAVDVPSDAGLSWKAADTATAHNVYFGTSLADVTGASRTDPKGVLVSQSQTETTYMPAGPLRFGQVYYWRVDEISDAGILKGAIWSFTAEPASYPIANVAVTASSFNAGMGPENTINGSGLNAANQHSVDPAQMWLSASGGTQPTWIQYEFDKSYKLDRLLVWNSNQSLESLLGFGVKDVIVAYSADGEVWTRLGDFRFSQAPGTSTYTPDTPVDFGGAVAKFVKLTISSNWGGLIAQYGLSEVRFSYVPVQAREPQPANTAADVSLDAQMNWRPGREATSHRVFFGADSTAVAAGTVAATTVTDHSYTPASMNFGTQYFWRVDEVGDAGTYKGDVWSFAAQEFAMIDDFEAYNDDDNRIYESWIDGMTTQASGSIVGYIDAPFAEKTIVHGGKQSMPFEYNNVNTPFYSEAEQEFTPAQNWTVNGADTLNLWVRGNPAAFVENPGTITMSAAGTDIWGNADNFRYAFKTLSGDGSVIVKVESVENTNVWAKAGVMIRQSLDADSKFVYFVQSFGSGVSMGWRSLTAGTCLSATQASIVAPQWVKLIRKGDVFTAQYSADGKAWTDLKNTDGTVASTTLAMNNPVYIGLCVTSHNVAATTTTVMSGAAATGNVTGNAWQVLAIGVDSQKANAPDSLYVTIQDSAGKTATAINATAATWAAWTQWEVPLSSLTGINLKSVKKMIVGAGSKANPAKGGGGMLYIDDIGIGHPVP
jgi:hypothetical protein